MCVFNTLYLHKILFFKWQYVATSSRHGSDSCCGMIPSCGGWRVRRMATIPKQLPSPRGSWGPWRMKVSICFAIQDLLDPID